MPQPMPLISQGVPAYTNDDSGTSFPASNANNGNYHDNWRCAAAPSGNANSGTLTQSPGFTTPFPVYLAYDLSSVPSSQRGQVVLAWYNDTPGVGAYNPTLTANNYFNNPRDYTIDVNAAAGGSLPGSGWVTKVTETNNPYHSRQYALDMTGYNWVRINVTAINGSLFNNNCELDMDVHDAHLGVQDSWIFYGDSITMSGLNHDDSGGLGTTTPVQIHTTRPAFYPVWEGAGIGGYTAADFVPLMATFLPLFPGHYVAVPLGTNDANGGGALVTNFSSNMQSIITSILSAGKIPVIPHIPWARTANVQANGPTLNATIDALIAANPGCLAGPDLWTYFFNNQNLITQSGSPDFDGLHPTSPAGYAAYRQQWVNWATSTIYLNILQTSVHANFKVRTLLKTPMRTAFKVRTLLKTPMRTAFKIQLSGVGPQPYAVVDVKTQMFVRPFSTVSSTATVVNQSYVRKDGLVATVTVTYPDNSTASAQVYGLGNGTYSTTYNTKGEGATTELWTFISDQGGQVECQHVLHCSF